MVISIVVYVNTILLFVISLLIIQMFNSGATYNNNSLPKSDSGLAKMFMAF